VLGAQTSAFAADYTGVVNTTSVAPGGVITYTSTDTDEAPGTTGTASLTGNLAAEEAEITATTASTLNQTVTVGADGTLGFTIKLPTSAPAGSTYTLAVSVGEFNDAKTLATVTVPADTAAGALPSTGVDATPYVWFGGGLLLLGAGLVSVLAFVRRSTKTA
jgi:LPXTG-motif cell wall-anchored protein